MVQVRALIVLLVGLAWFPSPPAKTDSDTWVLIDTRTQTLAVMDGEQRIKTFRNIALGRGGVSQERRRGDGKTPLGVFHVAWVNRRSPFHVFIGLDYPSWDYAAKAHRARLINDQTYNAIQDALIDGKAPPQDTPLGGHIGIHGLGRADPRIHGQFNWTKGCIALTNEQVEQLAGLVNLGTRVVIK
jgi:murein L,D-transpeptidase YafK